MDGLITAACSFSVMFGVVKYSLNSLVQGFSLQTGGRGRADGRELIVLGEKGRWCEELPQRRGTRWLHVVDGSQDVMPITSGRHESFHIV